MKRVLASANEAVSGVMFLALAGSISSIVEPHLGAIVSLPQETRWKFHFLAGACAVSGVLQLLGVIRDKHVVRLWLAWVGASIALLLAYVFVVVAFRGVAAWTVCLAISNVLAIRNGEIRENRPREA